MPTAYSDRARLASGSILPIRVAVAHHARVMSDAYQQYRERRHFDSLDGLRGLSILPVIWHHSALAPMPGLLGKGPAAVQLFFVLSGYLVTTLILRERSRDGTIHLGRFYARRGLRIFPLYYLVLGVVTLHTLVSPASPSRSQFLDDWFYFATYTSNWWADWKAPRPIIFGFAWTLAIEEQFYLLWPPVLRFARRVVTAAGFMSALLLLSQLVTWPECRAWFPEGSFWRTFCLGLSSSIALGSLLAIILHSRLGFHLLHRLLGAAWGAPFALAATAFSLVLEVHHLIFHVALCGLVAASVVRPDHGLQGVLNQPWLRHVGTLSYALYLTHFLAIGLTRTWVDPARPLAVFLCSLPLALLLAQTLHHFVERPFLGLKSRFEFAAGGERAVTEPVVPERLSDAPSCRGRTTTLRPLAAPAPRRVPRSS